MSESNKLRPIKSNPIQLIKTQPSETESSGIKLRSTKNTNWGSNIDEEKLERPTVSKLIGKYEQIEKLKNETPLKSPQSAKRGTLKKLKEKFEAQEKEKNSEKQIKSTFPTIKEAVTYYASLNCNKNESFTTGLIKITKQNEIDYFQTAQAHCEKNEPNKALTIYNKLIKYNNLNDKYHYEKGMILFEMKRQEEALECFQKGVELNPNEDKIWDAKGFAENCLNKLIESFESHTQAIVLNPTDPVYHYNKALNLKNSKRYEEAIEFFDKAEELCVDLLSSTKPNIQFYKSLCLLDLGRIDEADANMLKVKQLAVNLNEYQYYKKINQITNLTKLNQSDSIEYFETIIDYRIRVKDFAEAYNYALQAAEKHPSHAKFYFLKGFIASEDYEIDRAIINFRKGELIDLTNINSEHYWNILKLNEVIKETPNNSDCYFKKGFYLSHLTYCELAIDAFQKAIELDPNHSNYYFYQGYSYYRLDDYYEADKFFQLAIDLNPNLKIYYYYKDINFFSEFIKKNPKSADLYFFKGFNYLKMKEYNTALYYFKEASSLKPADPKYYFALTITSSYLGNLKRALDYMEILEVLMTNKGLIKKYRDIVSLQNEYSDKTLFLKGKMLADLNLNDLALDCLQEALKINPDFNECKTKLAEVENKIKESFVVLTIGNEVDVLDNYGEKITNKVF